MGKTQLEKSEATNRWISGNTKCNSKQSVEKANEHPEWLPDGWNVDFRTRKSGPRYGYKCYIDPNGNRFYSKPEVLRYLETINGNSCTSKKEERCNTMHSPNRDAVEKSTVEDLLPGSITGGKNRKGGNGNGKVVDAVQKPIVEDLPPGWITEVKFRKSGNSTNRKDVLYTDPVSGYVFHSKKDALRYLESGDISTCAIKPSKRQVEDEDKLTPSSAAKKQKIKPSATIQLILDANSSKKGQDVKTDSGVPVAPVPTSESVVKIQSLQNAAAHHPEIEKTSDPDDMQEKKNHVVNVTEITSKKNHSKRNVSKTKEFSVGQRFSPRLARVESDQLTNSVTNELTLQVPKRNLRKSRAVLDTDLANKSSQQLYGVPEIDHSHKMQGEVILNKGSMLSGCQALFRGQQLLLETDNILNDKSEQNHYSLSRDSSLPSLKVPVKTIRTELPSPDNSPTSHCLAPEASVSKENRLHVSQTRKSGLQEIHCNSNKSSNKKEHQIPRRASKRLAGSEPELMINSISYNTAPEYKSKKSKGEVQQSKGQPAIELANHALINGESSNKSGKTAKVPPLINGQLGKLEDKEIDDGQSEPQQSFTFHYSWSDPSLEFAIKTLTSALPVEDFVANGPTQIPEANMLPKKLLFENGTGSSSDKNLASALPVEDSVSTEPTQIPKSDILPKNKLFEKFTGSRNDKSPQVSSKKSKHKKEFNMPRRLSKRLAGNEPEVLPSERALEYDSVGKGSTQIPETDMLPQNRLSENVTQSSGVKNLKSALTVEDSVGSRPTQIPETDMLPKKKLLENVTGSSSDKRPQVNSKKSKNKKEFNVPRRLSKRLAGDEPDVLPAERALEYDSVGKGSTQTPETDMLPKHKLCENVSGSSSDKNLASALPVEDSVGTEPTQIPKSDMLPKNKLFEKFTGSSNDKITQASSMKSKNKKEVNMPRRLSKRLAGDEPEVLPTERAPEYATRKSSKENPTATVILTNGVSGPLHAGEESRLIVHAADRLEGESSNKSENACVQIAPSEQLQSVETENIDDDRSEPQFPLPFGDSWSDPCLEFAIKTLTGALPVDAAADILPFMIPDINEPPNKEFPESVVQQKSINEEAHGNSDQPQIKPVMIPDINDPPTKEFPDGVVQRSINEEAHDNSYQPQTKPVMIPDINDPPSKEFPESVLERSVNENTHDISNQAQIKPVMIPDINDPPNKEFHESVVQKSIDEEVYDNSIQPQTKKELNMVSQPSEQPLDQPEVRSSCATCENDPKFASSESHGDDAITTRKLDEGDSLHCKVEAGNITQIDINTVILEEPLKENEQVLLGESVAGQPQPETINHDNSAGEFCFPFMESWSDPCLEFAFKTLTGAMDDDIAIQKCFQEFANRNDQKDGGSMFPEFGSSSISQNDVSFHIDTGDKSMPGQQHSSSSSSFLPPEKSSLQGYTGVDPQNHYSQFNNNFQRR